MFSYVFVSRDCFLWFFLVFMWFSCFSWFWVRRLAGLAKVGEASQASDPKPRKTRKPHKHKEKPQKHFRVIRKRTKTLVFVCFRITRTLFCGFSLCLCGFRVFRGFGSDAWLAWQKLGRPAKHQTQLEINHNLMPGSSLHLCCFHIKNCIRNQSDSHTSYTHSTFAHIHTAHT